MRDDSLRVVRVVLAAGFLAGALDIVAAFMIYGWLGVSPVRIPIASVLNRDRSLARR